METSSISFNSLADFRERYRELLLRFLWRQWSALGVAGHASSADPWIIDPEALLLFSTGIARHDARLFDEILDWLAVNGSWINLQRLANIQRDSDLGDGTILSAMAEHLSRDSAIRKWAFMRNEDRSPVSDNRPQPLFRGVPVFGPTDELFLKWGWQRGPVQLRGMSQRPLPYKPETFLFKLRALFGRQSRAEVIAWLLSHESGHPAEVARDTGYFPRSIQVVLNELEQSGHVYVRMSGREKRFALLHSQWLFLLTWSPPLPDPFPRWANWTAFFQYLWRVHDWLEKHDIDHGSTPLLATELRKAIDIASLAKTGLPARFVPRPIPGEQFLKESLAELEKFLG
jgi:hypothetical protein